MTTKPAAWAGVSAGSVASSLAAWTGASTLSTASSTAACAGSSWSTTSPEDEGCECCGSNFETNSSYCMIIETKNTLKQFDIDI